MLRFTLWGLLQYDNTLFDNVILPDVIDKQICIDNIIDKSGDLYLYYQVPERAKAQITRWFEMHYLGFKRMAETLLIEYNPTENTDRYEDETATSDTVRTNQSSGSDSTHTDNENKTSAFDSSTYSPQDKFDGTESVTYGRKDDASGNDVTHRVLHTHGNIGVTSNVELISQELELRRYNLYDVIAEMFENDILIEVY